MGKENSISSFSICVVFISFSCLMTLANTSSKKLHRMAKSKHPCLVPYLGGKHLIT